MNKHFYDLNNRMIYVIIEESIYMRGVKRYGFTE